MKKLLFTVVLLVSAQTIAFCQGSSPVLDNAVSKIKSTITDHIIEKAYLHTDRPNSLYVAGETVYFKAYVTMGELHEPSRISGILHVDLIGKNDALLETRVIQLTNGTGSGDFMLPDTLQKGSYRLRAYTQYMRNGDPAYFFNKYISVGTINNADRGTAAVKQPLQPAIEFFPEGGNLVVDLRSKVAFKALGADGLGTNVKGTVFDSDGKAVAIINAAHLGMGVFDFIPEDGKKYTAKITFGNGVQSTVNLPAVEQKGITLALNTDDPAKISIEIKANRAYYKENLNKELNLLVYWSGQVKKVNTKLDNEVLGLDLPTAGMKTGVLQATLFSQKGEPMNERIAFIQNNDQLNVAIATGKQAYAKRENVQVNLNAKNKDGAPAGGSFSVSVVNESKVSVDEAAETTILSNLLLTSELKGYVEKPNYYFANVTKDTRAQLDALMLTQGYRRFVWKQLLNNNSAATAAVYKPEQFIDIAGKVKTKAGVALANAQVTLVPNAGGAARLDTTDANGNFKFASMSFTTGESFIVKTKSSPGKNAAVITLNSAAQGIAIAPGNEMEATYDTNADMLASLQAQRTGAMMASSDSRGYIKDRKVDHSKDNYRSSNIGGPGHADQVIHGDDIKSSPSLLIAINGLARGVDFVNGVPYLKTSLVSSSMNNVSEPMLIVIDGNIIQGGTTDLPTPRQVETIEILKGTNGAIYGSAGGAGVMVITTRMSLAEPETESKEMSPGVFSFSPAGFYKAKEFYSPRYDAAQTAATVPDTRTTIFWKPEVITDAGGNASINFFNADEKGTYRVTVEGIDVNGNLGRQVFKYKVE